MQGNCLSPRQWCFSVMAKAIFVIALAVLILWVWTAQAERFSHYTPEYSLADITPLLDGRPLTDADYEQIFAQTGLARPGVEQLWEENYRQESQVHGNQEHESQGHGNQGQESQGHGNQGQESQGHGNQGQESQGHGNQEQESQGQENQGQGNREYTRAGERSGHREDFQDVLLALQSRFFAEPEITCEQDMFLVWSEWLEQDEGNMSSAMLASEAGRWSVGQMTPVQCFPAVQDGDILVSFSSHIFGWRSGHAGIVVDAAAGRTLEAIAVGQNSGICSLDSWAEYPSVVLLRLKGVSREERAQVADFAEEYLVGLPYHIMSFTWTVPQMSAMAPSRSYGTPFVPETFIDPSSPSIVASASDPSVPSAFNSSVRSTVPSVSDLSVPSAVPSAFNSSVRSTGPSAFDQPVRSAIFSASAPSNPPIAASTSFPPLTLRIPSGTQCAHLVWTAYAHFGYDLDGDGGFVVTPSDLFQSELLEVVQIYGLDPKCIR